ncbi:MAG: carbon storage regulator [Sulfurospirillum sp.]|nr:carbon storage regulator [Sulfurospirillum sp.]MBL0703817.1 carbon storage regulator [Sulfurospirillum sp.]
MLMLSRKIGEAVILDKKITLRIMDISKSSVRIGFDAPSDILILREELQLEIKKVNIEAKNDKADIDALKTLSKKIKKK